MAAETLQYRDRIVADPRIMVGKPVIKGTRIPVELILKRLAQNPDVAALFEAYAHLAMDDVRACLSYAHALVEAETRPRPARTSKDPAPAPV
jgi:uncharacterized protein (DUF433 family)